MITNIEEFNTVACLPPFKHILLSTAKYNVGEGNRNRLVFLLNGVDEIYIESEEMISETHICIGKKSGKKIVVNYNELIETVNKFLSNIEGTEISKKQFNNNLNHVYNYYISNIGREEIRLETPNSVSKFVKIKFHGRLLISIDDKDSTELDVYNIIQNSTHGKDLIRLKKTTKGEILVNKDEFVNFINNIKPRTAEEERKIKIYTKKINDILKKGEIRIVNSEKKSDKTSFDIMLRNLKHYKDIFQELQNAFISIRNKSLKRHDEYYLNAIRKANIIISTDGSIDKYRELYYTVRQFYIKEKLKSDYLELVNIQAKEDVDVLEEEFLYKNSMKISTIVYHKGYDKFDSITTIHASETLLGFEGLFDVKFKDGSSFNVLNQAVWVDGYIQSSHYRFPTTFHKIQTSNGFKKAKMSEEEMIKDFPNK